VALVGPKTRAEHKSQFITCASKRWFGERIRRLQAVARTPGAQGLSVERERDAGRVSTEHASASSLRKRLSVLGLRSRGKSDILWVLAEFQAQRRRG